MPTATDSHRRGSPRVAATYLDAEYHGRAFPVPGAEPAYLRPEVISGAFHVKRWLADGRGEFGAVLERGGLAWVVYDLERLDWSQ